MEMKDKLNRRKHPFFEHGEADYFLACRGEKIVGRIAAILDRNHNEAHQEKTAFFGLYESFDDLETARAIIRKGYHWCELSWQLEDNQAINHFAASLGASLYRKYRIYEKQISGGGA